MIRTLIGGLFMVLFAGGALADPLVVRSGDHGTFTRLTVEMPKGADWDLAQSGDEARLHLGGAPVAFDVSEVYSRIGQDRLKQIAQAAPGDPLILDLNCECIVNAFEDGNTLLVLDIRSGRPKIITQVELPIVFDPPDRTVANIELPRPLRLANTRSKVPETSGLTVEGTAIQSQVERAILQGLLAPTAEHRAQSGPDQLEFLQRKPEQQGVNVRATTVIDRDLDGVHDGITADLRRSVCLDDDRLDISNWGDDHTHANIGERYLQVYGEFDRLNHEAVQSLAKAHLYLGFGAEAAATLGLDPNSANQVPELMSLAALIDDRRRTAPIVVTGQQACDGVVAFWALLADRELSEDANVEAIVNGFLVLPAHLRIHLGPRAATYLVNAGLNDMAKIMMRRSVPGVEDDTAAAQLVRAKLSEASGHAEKEMEHLEEVVSDRTDPPEAPAALMELIETAWESRLGINDANVNLAEAFAQEYKGSEVSPKLQQAHALALALSGNFSRAFEHPAMHFESDQVSVHELRRKSLTLLLENAEDITFLVHAIDQTSEQIAALDLQLRIVLASRLQQLGFPEQAMRYLDMPHAAGVPKTARLLQAQSSLETGLPRRALLELSNAEGETAQRLRAAALAKSNELTSAAEIYQELGDDDAAARSLWISEAWAAIPEISSSMYQEAGQLAADLAQEPAIEESPSLGAARSAAETARETRAQIESLLSVFERP